MIPSIYNDVHNVYFYEIILLDRIIIEQLLTPFMDIKTSLYSKYNDVDYLDMGDQYQYQSHIIHSKIKLTLDDLSNFEISTSNEKYSTSYFSIVGYSYRNLDKITLRGIPHWYYSYMCYDDLNDNSISDEKEFFNHPDVINIIRFKKLMKLKS